MDRLLNPTIAHPNFLPAESGTVTTLPDPGDEPSTRDLFSKGILHVHSSFTWDCVVSEFPPNASSNIPYIPPAISGRPEWNIFRATCTSFRQISSSSIHHESGFHPHGRELPSPAAAERNTRPRGHPPPDHPALR